MCQQIWKTRSAVAIGLENAIPIPKKRSSKECSNYWALVLTSHASKVMLKILQARLQHYMSFQMYKNFQMYKLGSEEVEKPEIKFSAFVGSWRKQGTSRKTSTSVSLTTQKPLTVWITTNCGKFLKRFEYQTTLLSS